MTAHIDTKKMLQPACRDAGTEDLRQSNDPALLDQGPSDGLIELGKPWKALDPIGHHRLH